MTAASARTVTASVLVLSVHSYGKRAVGEQLALREQLNAAVTLATGGISQGNRIVADTADGAAIVFLGGPVEALSAASTLSPALLPTVEGNTLPLRGGLNHGPVQLTTTEQKLEVSGDGMTVAETLAGFAETGLIVASRAFRDAAHEAGSDPRLQPLGTRTDRGVRAHELFLLRPATSSHGDVPTSRPSIRPRTVAIAGAALTALVLAGFAAREAREAIEAKRRPGVIRLAVRPAADVIVDSAYRGSTPPMKSVEVPPGRHTVELKRAGHPTRNVQVDLKPGEEIELQHTFFDKPRQKTFWERLGL